MASADFTGAVFGSHADFQDTYFDNQANFVGTIFGSHANFTGANFNMTSNFTGTTFGDGADFTNALFHGAAKFDKTRFKGSTEFTNARGGYFNISFANARFDGGASFSCRSFQRTADFTNTRFYYPPDFDGVSNPGKIDFTGAQVRFVPPGKRPWTEDSTIPVSLRAFRKIAEETKNHDLERDLYIEERKAERGVHLRQWWEKLKNEGWKNWPRNSARLLTHILWIIVMGAYSLVSDYGRSFVRPLVCWLVLSLIIFPWLYGRILPRPQSAGALEADKYEQAVQMVARSNAVPFVGPPAIDAEIKKILFCRNFGECRPLPPKSYQWLAVLQNVVSIILIFFVGLAMRNYFKIK